MNGSPEDPLRPQQLDSHGQSELTAANFESLSSVIDHDDITIQPSAKLQGTAKKTKQGISGKPKKRADSLATLTDLLRNNPTLHQRIAEAVVLDEETETFVIRSPRVEQREGISRRQFRQLALFQLETLLASARAKKMESSVDNNRKDNDPPPLKSTGTVHAGSLDSTPRTGLYSMEGAHVETTQTDNAREDEQKQTKRKVAGTASSKSKTIGQAKRATAKKSQQKKSVKVKSDGKLNSKSRGIQERQKGRNDTVTADWYPYAYPQYPPAPRIGYPGPNNTDAPFTRFGTESHPHMLESFPYPTSRGYVPYYDAYAADPYGSPYEPWNSFPGHEKLEKGKFATDMNGEDSTPISVIADGAGNVGSNVNVNPNTKPVGATRPGRTYNILLTNPPSRPHPDSSLPHSPYFAPPDIHASPLYFHMELKHPPPPQAKYPQHRPYQMTEEDLQRHRDMRPSDRHHVLPPPPLFNPHNFPPERDYDLSYDARFQDGHNRLCQKYPPTTVSVPSTSGRPTATSPPLHPYEPHPPSHPTSHRLNPTNNSPHLHSSESKRWDESFAPPYYNRAPEFSESRMPLNRPPPGHYSPLEASRGYSSSADLHMDFSGIRNPPMIHSLHNSSIDFPASSDPLGKVVDSLSKSNLSFFPNDEVTAGLREGHHDRHTPQSSKSVAVSASGRYDVEHASNLRANYSNSLMASTGLQGESFNSSTTSSGLNRHHLESDPSKEGRIVSVLVSSALAPDRENL